MEALEAIFTRRSIRKFEDRPVTKENLEQLLKAGMSAPSAGNEQPWHFIVITDRKVLDKIPEIHPYAQMLKEAPLAIMVCGDSTLEKHKGFWVVDCAAATENILVAATALGLGSVWLGCYPHMDRASAMKELFSLPDNVLPVSIIAIGYPGEKKPRSERFDEKRIHSDKW